MKKKLILLAKYKDYFLPSALFALCAGMIVLTLLIGAERVNRAQAWVNHSYIVIDKNQELAIRIERMVASQRGHALSGDEKFAERYETGKAETSDLLAELSALMQDKSAQLSRLNELQHHFLNFSGRLDAKIQAKRSGLPMPARAAAAGVETTESTDAIRDNIVRLNKDILLAEQESLNERLKKLTREKAAAGLAGIVAGILSVITCLGYAIYLLLSRERPGRRRGQQDPREMFYLALEGSSDGIFDWNVKNDRVFYSPQFWAMLGYEHDLFPETSQPIMDLIHPEDLSRFRAHIDKYLSGEISEYLIIFRMRHKSGKWVWINARARALYDDTGAPYRLIGAHTDISHLKAYEEKLEKAKETAEKASRAKTDFLAHMSHEIRTPLTAISGIAEILETTPANLDDKQRQLVRTLAASTSSLKDLVNDILDFSKIESGELELEEISFPLHELFEQVVGIVSVRANEKGLNFIFDGSAVGRQKFRGDRLRLRQILVNLIGNAVKFTGEGGVTVTARKVAEPGGATLQVEVRDTGIGIDPANIDLVFERFKQADSSVSRKYGGTGLGLSISRQLARLMDGDITVSSEPGKGSVFTLNVPLRGEEQSAAADTAAITRPAAGGTESPNFGGSRVLLVEDYEGNIALLSYMLESLRCGYDVARTGLDAVNMWKDGTYDLILMDVQMPEMDGFTATAQIRHMEREKNLPRTPIVGMTAHALVGDKEKCIEAGMDSYLPKPIVKADLYAKIAEFLSAGKDAA